MTNDEFQSLSEDIEDIISEIRELEGNLGNSYVRTVVNAIETPDGTILKSRSRHDFVSHEDSVDGKIYSADGGLSYLKRSGTNYKERSLLEIDKHSEIRKQFEWGSRGKWILLKDLEDEHLINILKDIYEDEIALPPVQVIQSFLNEFYWRRSLLVD